jgi:hypothetical protein
MPCLQCGEVDGVAAGRVGALGSHI